MLLKDTALALVIGLSHFLERIYLAATLPVVRTVRGNITSYAFAALLFHLCYGVGMVNVTLKRSTGFEVIA